MSDLQDHKLAANEAMVQRITNHLIASFEQFIDQEIAAGHEVGYLDSFMAAHNLHCSIVFHLEREANFEPKAAQMFRRMAMDTFKARLDTEPLSEE